MVIFLLSVPYSTGRERPFDDQLTDLARQGFYQYFDNGGVPSCGRVGCHQLPLTSSTNSNLLGLDAPTFRGLPDRWVLRPQGPHNVIEYVSAIGPENVEVPFDYDKGFDELNMFALEAFGTEDNPGAFRLESGFGPMGPWQMFLEASTGYSGAFARQTTLNTTSATSPAVSALEQLVAALHRVPRRHADERHIALVPVPLERLPTPHFAPFGKIVTHKNHFIHRKSLIFFKKLLIFIKSAS